MKLKDNGKTLLFCLITMIITTFSVLPKDEVIVKRHTVCDEIYYTVDLGDSKWITKAPKDKILYRQSWINTETGEECVKLNNIPLFIDSGELMDHVLNYWEENRINRLHGVAKSLTNEKD